MKCVSLQPSKLTEAFKYFIQGMGYSKSPEMGFIIEKYHKKMDEIGAFISITISTFIQREGIELIKNDIK